MLQLPEKGPFFKKLPRTSKKLVLVLALSMPVTDSSEEVIRIPCIYYPIQFQEGQGQESQEQVIALLNSGSKVNAINPTFAQKLGLYIRKTNVRA